MKSFFLILLFSFLWIGTGLTQVQIVSKPKFGIWDIKLKKTGPYFGYARGKFDTFELGVEHQIKKIRIKKPPTHAFHLGFNYNFKQHLMGYELGYWFRDGRLGLTYGGDFVLRTDFDNSRVGLGPAIGYKILAFHLQTGYHFLTKNAAMPETNTFFIRLRFTLIKERDWDFDRKKK